MVSTIPHDIAIPTTGAVDVPWKEITRVVLNGEGTMHHSSHNALKFLRALEKAQTLGIPTEIINTVWQAMPHEYDTILQKCDRIVVRENYSAEELVAHGVEAEVEPDRCIYVDVPYKHVSETYDILEGEYYFNRLRRTEYPRISIFQETWASLINKLRNTNILITGRHHEMYAGLLAGCRVVIESSRTHKNEGLFYTCGAEPPRDLHRALAGEYDDSYAKVRNYIDIHKVLS